jgi:putative iron-regulated protein
VAVRVGVGSVLVLAAMAAACAGRESVSSQVVANYADLVHEEYRASLGSAQDLAAAIDDFLAAPSPSAFDAAKQAWLDARDDYGPTEAFRFYGGPIDADDGGVEGLVNAWPLDEAYIDYVDGAPSSGIVNDPSDYPTIDADLLISLNEQGGETNIATGWHAIEFLLWGQDLDEDGPGARPYTDYTTADNADRRSAYLSVVSDLLVEHLTSLVEAWDPGLESNYRAEFESLPVEEALSMIVTGVGELTRGELAGERLTVAYEERSQENEHSCFSDNTTSDIAANARGIEAVLTGDYGSVSGPGVIDLIAQFDEDASARLDEAVHASVAAAESIPAPFDRNIAAGVPDSDPGRMAILTTIQELDAQADVIVQGAAAAGLDINLS